MEPPRLDAEIGGNEAEGGVGRVRRIVANTPVFELPAQAAASKPAELVKAPTTYLQRALGYSHTGTKEEKAAFNRLHPIPFTVTIPPDEIDKLPRKLLAEAEGILAWAVEGAQEWRRHGLGEPPEVNAANDDWRSENDQLGRFIEDCCVVGDPFSSRARPLHLRYHEWAEGAGETTITKTMFGRRLKGRGFAKVDRKYGAVYAGIALRANKRLARLCGAPRRSLRCAITLPRGDIMTSEHCACLLLPARPSLLKLYVLKLTRSVEAQL